MSVGVHTHASAANFIYGNYQQALGIIKNDSAAFEVMAEGLKITAEDCEQYLKDERRFLAHAREPLQMTQNINYLEALMTLEKTEYFTSQLTTVFCAQLSMNSCIGLTMQPQ